MSRPVLEDSEAILAIPKVVGICQICGRRAELERMNGDRSFEMCPHCAYVTNQLDHHP